MKIFLNTVYKYRRQIPLIFLIFIALALVCSMAFFSGDSKVEQGHQSIEVPNSAVESKEPECSAGGPYISEDLSSIEESSIEDIIIPELGTYEEDFDVLEVEDIIFLDIKLYNETSATFNKTDGAQYLDDVATLLSRYAPNELLISAACAIAYTEGGSGKSGIYTATNNCFGLRATSTWDGYVFARSTGRVYKDYKTAVKYGAYDFFRAYDSMEESIMDFIAVMQNSYTGVLEVTTPRAYFKFLLARGYGNKDVFSTWMYIVNLYDLTQYDK